jgi:hypothetical protein
MISKRVSLRIKTPRAWAAAKGLDAAGCVDGNWQAGYMRIRVAAGALGVAGKPVRVLDRGREREAVEFAAVDAVNTLSSAKELNITAAAAMNAVERLGTFLIELPPPRDQRLHIHSWNVRGISRARRPAPIRFLCRG